MTQGAFCQESFSCECAPGISSFCDGGEVHFLVSSPLNWGWWPVHCDQHCLVLSRCALCLHRLLGRILYQLRLWDIHCIHCPSGVATPRPPVLSSASLCKTQPRLSWRGGFTGPTPPTGSTWGFLAIGLLSAGPPNKPIKANDKEPN